MRTIFVFIIALLAGCNFAKAQDTTYLNKQDASGTKTMVRDIDGNVYHTIVIGHQEWMVENLKTTRYRSGDSIRTTTPVFLDISEETSPKYQWAYNNNDSLVAAYGRLYTWFAAADSLNICPSGWRLPTKAEWKALQSFVLKQSKKGLTLNENGFSAFPSGLRGSDGNFLGLGEDGGWWASTASEILKDSADGLFFNGNTLYVGYGVKNSGFSVRCIRDK